MPASRKQNSSRLFEFGPYAMNQVIERMAWYKPKTLDFPVREKRHYLFTSKLHFSVLPVTAFYYLN